MLGPEHMPYNSPKKEGSMPVMHDVHIPLDNRSLRMGIKGAAEIITMVGGIWPLAVLSLDTLQSIPGVNPTAATRLVGRLGSYRVPPRDRGQTDRERIDQLFGCIEDAPISVGHLHYVGEGSQQHLAPKKLRVVMLRENAEVFGLYRTLDRRRMTIADIAVEGMDAFANRVRNAWQPKSVSMEPEIDDLTERIRSHGIPVFAYPAQYADPVMQ